MPIWQYNETLSKSPWIEIYGMVHISDSISLYLNSYMYDGILWIIIDNGYVSGPPPPQFFGPFNQARAEKLNTRETIDKNLIFHVRPSCHTCSVFPYQRKKVRPFECGFNCKVLPRSPLAVRFFTRYSWKRLAKLLNFNLDK